MKEATCLEVANAIWAADLAELLQGGEALQGHFGKRALHQAGIHGV